MSVGRPCPRPPLCLSLSIYLSISFVLTVPLPPSFAPRHFFSFCCFVLRTVQWYLKGPWEQSNPRVQRSETFRFCSLYITSEWLIILLFQIFVLPTLRVHLREKRKWNLDSMVVESGRWLGCRALDRTSNNSGSIPSLPNGFFFNFSPLSLTHIRRCKVKFGSIKFFLVCFVCLLLFACRFCPSKKSVFLCSWCFPSCWVEGLCFVFTHWLVLFCYVYAVFSCLQIDDERIPDDFTYIVQSVQLRSNAIDRNVLKMRVGPCMFFFVVCLCHMWSSSLCAPVTESA